MATASDREAAVALSKRIKAGLVDPSRADEAHRPPSDRSPKFADVLMSEAKSSVERAANVSANDWDLIARALDFYAASIKE